MQNQKSKIITTIVKILVEMIPLKHSNALYFEPSIQ